MIHGNYLSGIVGVFISQHGGHMSFTSTHLSLPYLAPAQAQKHVTHNEGLRMLDVLVHLSVMTNALNSAPPNPHDGHRYLIGPEPEGEWAGRSEQIAAYQDDAWHYFIPQKGWQCFIEDQNVSVMFNGVKWCAMNSDLGENAEIHNANMIGLNAQADQVNRLTVKSDAVLFSHDATGSQQLKINKAEAADTASLVLQSGYTGHGEIGLTGDKNLHIKVSQDGSVFKDALIVSERGISTPLGLYPDLYIEGVTATGGAHIVTGPPNVITLAIDRITLSLTAGRVYFCSFYVDRPIQYLGAISAIRQGAVETNAIVRAGLYALGTPNDNRWNIGQGIVELGAHSAHDAGHLSFDAPNPITLEPGWYAHAFGTNGSGVSVRAAKWYTPGQGRYMPFNTGENADFYIAGASRFLYTNNQENLIENGFPLDLSDMNLNYAISVTTYVPQMLICRWSL